MTSTINVDNLILRIKYTDIRDQIGAHSIYLSRLKDKDDEKQGKVEFNFQKNWIVLTSFSGYGFFRTKIKCNNPFVDERVIKPVVVDIKDAQYLVKSFDIFGSEHIEIDSSISMLGFRLPSDFSKKAKNNIRTYDIVSPKLSNRNKIREMEGIDTSFLLPILSRIISVNSLTDSGAYFDFMNLIIDKKMCRATSGNGSFFSSIEWNQEPSLAESGSWALSVSAIAMIIRVIKKFKSKTITIIEYENCINYKLDSFDVISLDKFDSSWPDIKSIIKRDNDIELSINADSANHIRGFFAPILDQAQRDKVDIPSMSFSVDMSKSPSIELQSNFRDDIYFTLDKESVSIEKNDNMTSIFNCNISLKSLIDSMNVSSLTKSVSVKLSECDFNGHSSPVLIEHNEDADCRFSSFFAQMD